MNGQLLAASMLARSSHKKEQAGPPKNNACCCPLPRVNGSMNLWNTSPEPRNCVFKTATCLSRVAAAAVTSDFLLLAVTPPPAPVCCSRGNTPGRNFIGPIGAIAPRGELLVK